MITGPDDSTSGSMDSDSKNVSGEQISTDRVFDILRNSRRRAVLDHLRDGDATSTL